MTGLEKKYNDDEVFIKEFEDLYTQVLKKYSTKKLRKYIHYRSTYNLFVGLKTAKIKRKSLKFRVLLIEYLLYLIKSDKLFEKKRRNVENESVYIERTFIYPIGKFLGAHQGYSYIEYYYTLLGVIIVGVLIGWLIGSYLIGIVFILVVIIIRSLVLYKKLKSHKVYGFRY